MRKFCHYILKCVCPRLFPPIRLVFMKNRYSFFKIRLLLNILYSPSPPDIPQVLLSARRQDIKRWDLLLLSLCGRINIIKMNVLPKFLYLFQGLPMGLLSKFFIRSVYTLILAFIWNNKNPRIWKCVLQKPRPQGGMTLPNFLFYYWAANIRALIYWIRHVDGRIGCIWRVHRGMLPLCQHYFVPNSH